MVTLTEREERYGHEIRNKDGALRDFISGNALPLYLDERAWLTYLTGIKAILGNLSNDIGFVATLLVKRYLAERFAIVDFDAAAKAQGAPGEDIVAVTADGRQIIGELKTTTPYQPGFGSQQRTTIIKDLVRLAASPAYFRFMFVTDPETFAILCKPSWMARAPGVEIVDLVGGHSVCCPTAGAP
jgi:hypothetical protein